MSTISASTTTTTAFKVTSDTTGTLVLQTGSTPTTAVTIDTSGNFGLGVVPSAWNANSLQIAGNMGFTVAGNFTANAYYNGTFKYTTSGSLASTYQQSAGIHTWSTAPSGTAGNTITFTEAMRLDASGNLGLGVTPSAWATYPALQVNKGSLWGPGSSFYNSANLYYDGTNRRYIASSYASEYEQASGQHIWLNAPSGTAGNVVTLTQAMTLTAAGRLGIATTSPSDVLGISGGGIRIEGWNNDATFIQQQYSASYFQRIAGDAATRQLRLESNSSDGGVSGSIVFKTSGSGTLATTMTLDGLGTLGVGITPNSWGGGSKAIQLPGGALSGYSGASNNQTILWNNCYYGTNFTYVNTDYANYFRMYNGDYAWFNAPSGTAGTTPTFTQVMTLDKNGNLGIGTTSPTGRFEASAANCLVYSTGTAGYGAFYARGSGTNSSYLFLGNATSGEQVRLTCINGGDLTFSNTASATERMRLDSSGNLLVGTTSTYNSAKVSVNGDVEARGNIKTRYGAYGALANGASLTLMSFPNGSYGSQLDGVLVVEQRDDSGGNLTTSTYLVSAYGGSGANFTAVSTQTYAGGQSFTIGSTTSSGNLVISITNTSGRACTSVNYTFLALKGGSTITYAF